MKRYVNFLASATGQIQQQVLWDALKKHLTQNSQQEILDAACGPGWLTKKLAESFPKVQGFDDSEVLIKIARNECKGINFKIADVTQPLPYPENFFDAVIFNMAAMDVDNLSAAFKNLLSIIKPTGQLLLTIPNPYYTYPVAVWKRSIFDVLLGSKPRLKLNSDYFHSGQTVEREFKKGETIASHFYKLADYLTAARSAGFGLKTLEEISSATDDSKFNLRYQLYRYPLLLLLGFGKTAQGSPPLF